MPVGYSIYRESPSPVHQRIDPRTKMVWLVAVFGIALCFSNVIVLGAVGLILVIVARIAQLRWRDVRGMVLLSLWLIALSVLIWPAYVTGGLVLFVVGPFHVTGSGLLFGLAMGLRISLMLFAATVWMLTTSPQRLTGGLLAIGLPYKAGMAMSLALRFVPLMNAEQKTILEAQRARGLDLTRGNPLRRIVMASAVLVPLFTRAFLTAQNLTVAMDVRGFGAKKGRTTILSLNFTRLDQFLCAVAILALVVSIALRAVGAPVTLGTTF